MHERMASLKFVCTNNYKSFTKFIGRLKVTVNSPNAGRKSPILKESPLSANSNTYVSDLKKNKGPKILWFHVLGYKALRSFWVLFLSFDSIWGVPKWCEDKRVLRYAYGYRWQRKWIIFFFQLYKDKTMWMPTTHRSPPELSVSLKQGSIKGFPPQFIPIHSN